MRFARRKRTSDLVLSLSISSLFTGYTYAGELAMQDHATLRATELCSRKSPLPPALLRKGALGSDTTFKARKVSSSSSSSRANSNCARCTLAWTLEGSSRMAFCKRRLSDAYVAQAPSLRSFCAALIIARLFSRRSKPSLQASVIAFRHSSLSP